MEFIITFAKLFLLSTAVLLSAQDVAAFHPLRTKTSLATFNAAMNTPAPNLEIVSLLISQVCFVASYCSALTLSSGFCRLRLVMWTFYACKEFILQIFNDKSTRA